MNFIAREEIIDLLKSKVGEFKGGWLLNSFDAVFESEDQLLDLDAGDAIALICKIMEQVGVENLLMIPDSSGWEDIDDGKKLQAVSFSSVKEATDFLEENMWFGVDNYYLFPRNTEWIITICHEEDIHVNGAASFLEEFKQLTSK